MERFSEGGVLTDREENALPKSRLSPLLGQCLPSNPPSSRPVEALASPSGADFRKRGKWGLSSPLQLPSVALSDWLCIPGAQLQSLQTLSEPPEETKHCDPGPEERPPILGFGISRAPGGRGPDRVGPVAGSRPNSPRLAVSVPLRPLPLLPSQRRPPSSLTPPPNPPACPPPPPGFSFLPLARSAAHSAAAAS